jgi:carbon monoxide dehydrogenase subunit G
VSVIEVMAEAEQEITIDRPREDVFNFLADAENDAAWRPGVLDITHTSGSGAGARYRQGVKGPFGRRIPADIEITEFKPSELIAFRTLSGPIRPTGRYELAEVDAGTRVRFALEAELKGLQKLMAPMVKKSMGNQVGALVKLKQALETAP